MQPAGEIKMCSMRHNDEVGQVILQLHTSKVVC